MLTPIAPKTGQIPVAKPEIDATLQKQAKALETAFLSEMLGYAGLGAARDSFGGGIGEQQFGSFLREQQAKALGDSGGIGLAESLFRALSGAQDAKR